VSTKSGVGDVFAGDDPLDVVVGVDYDEMSQAHSAELTGGREGGSGEEKSGMGRGRTDWCVLATEALSWIMKAEVSM
jgi:hypothetical protein